MTSAIFPARNTPQCEDVFGAGLDFPLSGSNSAAVVYNCDPDGSKGGLFPATINTVGATECACPLGRTLKDGACALPTTPEEQCDAAGWVYDAAGWCDIGFQAPGEANPGRCFFDSARSSASGTDVHCKDVFGGDYNFPQKPPDGSASVYAYNCDPDGSKGGLPATVNLTGETACRCDDSGGTWPNCAGKTCSDAGWDYAGADGACGVLVTLSGGETHDQCRFTTGLDSPQCADIFGAAATLTLPAPTVDAGGATLRFVYGCDPNETSGLLPATINTIAATACACAAGEEVINGECVSSAVANSCRAGWTLSVDDGSCGILVTLSGGDSSDFCRLTGSDSPQCADVFGAGATLPAPTVGADGATLRFVYDCDPDGTSGLLPATANTIGATECGCPSGEHLLDGQCAPSPTADSCLTGGWPLSLSDGACGVLVTMFDGDSADRCYLTGFTGLDSPQCADVFGTAALIPAPTVDADGATLRFVYNCDQAGTNGLLPATANTIGATECGCPSGEHLLDGQCAPSPTADSCLTGGWPLSLSDGACGVLVTMFDGDSADRCYLTGFAGLDSPQCADVFGTAALIPAPTVDAGGATLRFIYNCDQDGTAGLLPATANTVGATACSCAAAGKHLIGDACVSSPAVDNCLAGGWNLSLADGACGVPMTLSGGAAYDRCYFFGSNLPQCADVFGVSGAIPPPTVNVSGATLRFVYNCDPDGDRGGVIPAAENTTGATECSCAATGQTLQDGVCGCPAGQAVQGGRCAACPSGQGVLADGTCGACPTGASVQSGVCQCDAAGQVAGRSSCACPAGKIADNNACVEPTTEAERCRAAQWQYAAHDAADRQTLGDGRCFISTRNVGNNSDNDACNVLDASGGGSIQFPCSDIFGDALPTRPADLSSPRYVYNCDPDNDTGLLPATKNTIEATECACPDGQGILADGNCGVCPIGQGIIDGACLPVVVASGARRCAAAGRTFDSSNGGSCAAAITLSGGALFDKCYFSDTNTPQCEDVFGAGLNFPPAGSNSAAVVYNCDPNGDTGLLPATINTVAATACFCSDGERLIGGVCVARAVTDSCQAAGWPLFATDGACGAPVTLFGGTGSDRCYLTGTKSPQCADVFGASVEIPKPVVDIFGATLSFVYRCDPDGGLGGLIPATVNTIGATACGCPSKGALINGVCENPRDKCTDAGWDYDAYSDLCGIHSQAFGVNPRNFCRFDDAPSHSRDLFQRCADIFGDEYDFPQKPPDGSVPTYIYNCDPYGRTGGAPARANRNGETECGCDGSGGTWPNCAAKACLDAGWDYAGSGGTCGVLLTLSGGAAHDRCHFTGATAPQCAEVFGADLDFPAPTLSTLGATLRFVYNCDPDGETGLIPATANIVGATACGCPDGEYLFGGRCVTAPAADSCQAAGWPVLAADGACGVLITLADGAVSDRCYFIGSSSPQCADVFGVSEVIPAPTVAADGATLRFVYNCDEDGESGLIPAAENTAGATACSCAGEGQTLRNGVCACPAGQAVQNGACAACPTGQGVLDGDGICGTCPDGSTEVNGVCQCAITGQVAGIDSCACPVGQLLKGGACVNPTTEAERCRAAQWQYAARDMADHRTLGDGRCFISTRDVDDNRDDDACNVLDSSDGRSIEFPCSDIFGDALPTPVVDGGGATLRFVYNCDPDGTNGLMPATKNTIGATECACPSEQGVLADGTCGVCPSGQGLVDGACLPVVVAFGARRCAAAGKTFDSSDGGSCAVAITLAGEADFDKCYFSGEVSPQCTDVFGVNLAFPAADVTVIYNCDPDGSAGGLIPATANTVGATACGCSDGEELIGGGCVANAVADRCRLNWPLLAEDGACGIPLTLSGDAAGDRCYLTGSASPQCADIFGAGLDFPAPALSALGVTLPFVYNCDPNRVTGLVPATANTIGATACGCAAGMEMIGGKCVVNAAANSCRAGWTLFAADSACGIPVTLSGGAASDRCHLVGSADPQCADVFGSGEALPPPVVDGGGATLRFVYNCDPRGTNGMIPATANTIGATECVCPAGEVEIDGECRKISPISGFGGQMLMTMAYLHNSESRPLYPIMMAAISARHIGRPNYYGLVSAYDDFSASDRIGYTRIISAAFDLGAAGVTADDIRLTRQGLLKVILDQIPAVGVPTVKCEDRSWTVLAMGGACGIPITLSGGGASDRCYFPGFASPQCADVFGEGFDFPAPALSASGAALSFVYNCDPRGITGLLPATVNTIGATACVCPAEQIVYEGVCAFIPDVGLISETLSPSPDLAAARTLLDNGANPNVLLRPDGTALLAAAVTMNHAGLVSVLITAGANPTLRVTRGADSHLLPDFFATLPDGIEGANLLIHWDGAVQGAALTSDVAFNWRGAAGDGFIRRALDTHARAGLSEIRQAETEVMISYAQSRGGRGNCGVPPFADERACNARRICGATADFTAYSCLACPGAPLRSADGASCVSACGDAEILGAPTSWGEAQCGCPAAGQGVAEGVCRICPAGTRLRQGACACPVAGEGLIDGVCALCPQGASLVGGSCACPFGQEAAVGFCLSPAIASAARKCAAAGWNFSSGAGGTCELPIKLANGNAFDGCHLSGKFIPQCAAVFGADLDFPTPIVRGGATLRFVYNCDPHGTNGRVPATVNTVGATSCCDAGQSASRATGGVCLDPEQEAEAQKCADAGWEYSAANGGACEVPVMLSGANLFRRCYFSGNFIPQCAAVFGDGLAFPAKPPPPAPPAAFVYDCDPVGASGLIPATVNTLGATACACPLGGGGDNCACPAGENVVEGVCRLPEDAALISEALSPRPRLSTIRALLDGGANPAVTLAGGAPLVIAALTLNRPGVLSVLITAGASPYVVYNFRAPAGAGALGEPVNIPLHITGLDRSGGLELLRHWGGAAAILAGGPTLDWSAARGNSDGAFRNLADRYYAAGSGRRAEMRAMGGYLLDLGADCSDYVSTSVFNLGIDYTPLCNSRLSCPSARGGFVHDCLACSGAPLQQGAACVSVDAAQNCEDAGWGRLPGDDRCGIPVTLSGGGAADQCHFSGDNAPQCASVFGALLDFPAPTLAADGATLRFVYNCDPDGEKRQIPTTINTIGATMCGCAASGEEVVDGACVPVCADDEIRVGGICVPSNVVDLCESAGWPLLAAEGACGILLTLSGGATFDRCHITGSVAPQCKDVFGATLHYFPAPTVGADGATLRFVYNCDPNGQTGFVPATANTVAATACGCPDGQTPVDGACVAEVIAAGAQSCRDAGRAYDVDNGGGCAVAITLFGGAEFDKCYFSGVKAPQCADVFGADPAFPAADVTVIYNCDPNGVSGLIPATINTVEATECSCLGGLAAVNGVCAFACADNEALVNGVCVPASLEFAAQKCADANREFSPSDGGSCVVPVRPAGGNVFSRCYFSGSFDPQCADVFGADLAFPDQLSAPIVYNCDPLGQTGLLPATTNTIEATECVCPAGEEPVGGVCASSDVVDLCASAGWVLSAGEGSCGIPVTRPGGVDFDGCYLTGSADPQCADVFGSAVNYFPAPTVGVDGATLRFVFNCDPDGSKGQIPASANTIGATECSCVDGGEQVVGDVCVPDAIAIGAQKCLDAGRGFFEVNGGGCRVAVTLSGGDDYDRCYLTRGNDPQCEEIFGAGLAFPADPNVTVIYNCDPKDQTGFIPATINTVGATECSCPVGENPVGGVCVPDAIAVGAQNCLNAGRDFSKPDGGSCAVAVTLSGEAEFDRCYLSGPKSPQCEDVFGAGLVFPAAGSNSAPVIYNCDPKDQTGFIPATINTVGATECACPVGEEPVGGACVSSAIAVEARRCLDAGWVFSEADGGGCAVPLAPAGAPDSDRCYFTDSAQPQCSDVFGAIVNYFPAPTVAAGGATLRFVYDCDPDGTKGFLPATINTVRATACACPAGHDIVGDVCVLNAVATGAQNCLDANRELSAADGGSCAAAIRLAGGGLFDKCHFSGELSPQCEKVFGTGLVFPAADPGVTVIYNCDPDGGKGLVPATINTNGATDCSCAVAEQNIVGGVCRCPDGQGLLAGGTCGACAKDGEGVLSDGTCGACPFGHAIDSGVCIASAIVDLCENAGWASSLSGGGACEIPLTGSGGEAVDQCYFTGSAKPQCADVFGATVNYFPAPMIAAGGATLRFVYDCDPDGTKGFLPATTNTVKATECACPVGEEPVGGACVSSAIAVEARRCLDAGWAFSEANGGGCAVPLAPAGAPDSDRCYFTDSAQPQCSDVFGAIVNYFPAPTVAAGGATLRFVYDCDPDGTKGFLPATLNTVGATACVCPAGETSAGGACVPDEIAVGAQNCLDAARDFSEADGGSCVVPVRPANGNVFSRCYFSDSFSPQCEDVFGPALAFPARLTAPVIYNCDPSGENGLLPATINTVVATACSCPAGEEEAGGICVSSAVLSQCAAAGWALSAADGSCGAPVTLSGGAASDRCYFAGSARPQCADVFGATVNFPAPTLAASGATLRFVYGCDPDGSRSQIPATANTIGATECSCVANGEEIVGGAGGSCVPDAIAVGAQKCLDSGRNFFEVNGGGCRIAVTLSGGLDSDRCYFSGDNFPQCEDVFGANLAFPADDPGAPVIYNCDPDGDKGFLPATINTNGATACVCPGGEEPVGGICVPNAIAVGAQNCLDAARVFDAANGGSCAVAVTLSGGADSDRCYLSGPKSPQCEDVFGAGLVFPAAGSNSAPVIYNCDPDGSKGFLPATINTDGATACACPSGEAPVDGACVPGAIAVEAQNCLDAGWEFSEADGGSCAVPLTSVGGLEFDRCYLSGSNSPQCADVFGAADFPAPVVSGESTLSFVYNCDPNESTGFLPATINTNGATECSCPPGEELIGVCVPGAIAVGTANCLQAGRAFDAADGGSCVVPVKPAGQSAFSRCYFSGSFVPQCEDIFGPGLVFPARLSAPVIYNCDPSDENGLLPATVNTVAATECSCPADRSLLAGGYCIPNVIGELCERAGWTFSAVDGACGAPVTLAGGAASDRCYVSGSAEPQCSDVFGATVNYFPAPALATDGTTLSFVYGCDPDGDKGFLPATINTNGATACVCPVGEEPAGGYCIPGVVGELCASAGWTFSAADGACGAPVTLAGGAASDRCYVSGSAEPQCSDVFGATVNYFPAPALATDGTTLSFVYGCDPDNDRGGAIPAAENTISATECACGDLSYPYREGACVPKTGSFERLSDKVLCGAFGGTVRIATGGEVCSGMDRNDTFCVTDSADAFSCRGLFKHLRACNLEFNRPALNPFFCGENCGEEMEALGAWCRNR